MKTCMTILVTSLFLSCMSLPDIANACPQPFSVIPGVNAKLSQTMTNSYEDNVGYYECSANGICYLIESEFNFDVSPYPELGDDVIVGLGASSAQSATTQSKSGQTVDGVGEEDCIKKLPEIVATAPRPSGSGGVLRLSVRPGGVNSGGNGGSASAVASGQNDKDRGCTTGMGQMSCTISIVEQCGRTEAPLVVASIAPTRTDREYYVTINHPDGSSRWIISQTGGVFHAENLSKSCH